MRFDALDDFAGPGGWDEGARMIGLRTVGIEWDMAACQTAKAAGHARIRADVAAYPSAPFAGIPGYIASPPCQAWSMAGKRKGELDRANCHVLADRMAQGDDSTDWTEWEDPRSALVCQPVRRVRELRPAWVALEEVPAVLGLWEHFARIFRAWGYSTWVGVLNAADYGVPQTRQRCVLMASRVGAVAPPVPTHSRDGDEGDLFGGSRTKWVSMARALGWEAGLEVNTRGNRQTPGGNEFGADRPSWALTEKTRWWFVSAGVTGEGRPKDPETQPADTLTGKGTAYWMGDVRSSNGCVRHVSEPSPTLTSSMDNGNFQWVGEGKARVEVDEAGVLQSFPAVYPWAGSRTKQYQQVGNAIPPLMAAHILAALTGRTLAVAA